MQKQLNEFTNISKSDKAIDELTESLRELETPSKRKEMPKEERNAFTILMDASKEHAKATMSSAMARDLYRKQNREK